LNPHLLVHHSKIIFRERKHRRHTTEKSYVIFASGENKKLYGLTMGKKKDFFNVEDEVNEKSEEKYDIV